MPKEQPEKEFDIDDAKAVLEELAVRIATLEQQFDRHAHLPDGSIALRHG